MKQLVFILYCLACVIITPFAAVVYYFKVRFRPFIREMEFSYRKVLCRAQDFLRRHTKLRCACGLRYSATYLKQLTIQQVLAWDIDKMAELAHEQTEMFVSNYIKRGEPKNPKLRTMDVIYPDTIDESRFPELADKATLMTLGDYAYVFLHHPDKGCCEKAFNFIYYMRQRHNIQVNAA